MGGRSPRRFGRTALRVAVLVAVATVFAALLTSAGGARTANSAPEISCCIEATFISEQFATHYLVSATDPDGDTLTYAWTLHPPANDPGCDNQGKTRGTASEFVWLHGDQHGCDHTKQGPRGHQGSVDVVVSDGVWSCKATYSGTISGPGPEPSPCTAVPTTPPKTKPHPCHCLKLQAVIDPTSIALYGPHVLGRFRMEFTVDWMLTCSPGTGGCHGRFDVFPPAGARGLHPIGGVINCDAKCDKTVKGETTFTVFGGPLLDHKHRAGMAVSMKVTRSCQGHKLPAARFFTFMFDKQGFVDKQRSRFVVK